MTIQDDALAASHAQSRFAFTLIVPVPPDAGAVSSELEADTPHFDAVGALTDSSLELQAASESASATIER
jgi:hypothetical protein